MVCNVPVLLEKPSLVIIGKRKVHKGLATGAYSLPLYISFGKRRWINSDVTYTSHVLIHRKKDRKILV